MHSLYTRTRIAGGRRNGWFFFQISCLHANVSGLRGASVVQRVYVQRARAARTRHAHPSAYSGRRYSGRRLSRATVSSSRGGLTRIIIGSSELRNIFQYSFFVFFFFKASRLFRTKTIPSVYPEDGGVRERSFLAGRKGGLFFFRTIGKITNDLFQAQFV